MPFNNNDNCDIPNTLVTADVPEYREGNKRSIQANVIGFTSFNLNPNAKTFVPNSIKPTNPITLLNPGAKSFIPTYLQINIPLKPYANDFLSEQKILTKTVILKSSFNPYAKAFTMTYKPFKVTLSNDARIFVPHHLALLGIRTISVILVMIIILSSLILNILVNPGKNVGELPPKDLLKKRKISNPNNLIIGHLNINSIRYKYECLNDIIDKNVDILLISETKLNDSFPTGQFLMNGFHLPFRKDRTDKGGGLLFYIQEDVPCREIMVTLESNKEAIFVEINLRKRKWLIIGGYNPDKAKIPNFLSCIESQLNDLCQKYENIILMGDLNSEMSEERMNIFCNTYYYKCLVKEPTCFKNINNPSCVDLILTNKSLFFQHTKVIETSLSDFYRSKIATKSFNL